ncbi:hypothetical protein AYK20_05415 [Thermoplasmatales archaeon SG8-52-1]|nr:MAG: hypothetical protein AYK20_05415 [Thermoplasmatales archaeon SG8-52-1]
MNKSIEKKDDLESKADDLAKKHGFFKNDKIGQIDQKKNQLLHSNKDEFIEFKKKYEKNLIFTDIDLSQVKELNEEEIKILDETIKEFPIIDEDLFLKKESW